MSEAKYVSTEALDAYTQALSEKLGRKLANVYTIKGSAIYADTDYLASPDIVSGSIDSVGLWHQVDGNWVKITTFLPGWVYNISNAFHTDNNFIDANNKPVAASSNIVVVNVGTDADPVLKFDAIAIGTANGGSSVDLSAYDTSAQVTSKINTALNDYDDSSEVTGKINTALASYDTSAQVTSKINTALNDYATTADVTSKQDKVMTNEPDIIVPDLTYADSTARTTDTTDNVSDGNIAYQEDTEEYYYAEVSGSTILWHDIGNTKTVEGAIKLIGSIMPIKPISTAEIQAMFA
ncbi:MAG: hypothetical protein J6Y02_03760 [Pseudobutyrivibrio sp.]|nr:hypothetical protein [Pseudobutyrivibrio sp.]